MKNKGLAQFFSKAAELFGNSQLNSSLCLIFNGMASMIAIAFLVLFAIGKPDMLFWLGIAGCVCMILANITDLFPFWLKGIAKKLAGNNENHIPLPQHSTSQRGSLK